jgi:hypothetical protein
MLVIPNIILIIFCILEDYCFTCNISEKGVKENSHVLV